MQVQIAAKRIFINASCRILRAAAQLGKTERAYSLRLIRSFFYREVELMPVQDKPRRTKYRIFRLLRFNIADHLQFLRHLRLCGEDTGHLVNSTGKIS